MSLANALHVHTKLFVALFCYTVDSVLSILFAFQQHKKIILFIYSLAKCKIFTDKVELVVIHQLMMV